MEIFKKKVCLRSAYRRHLLSARPRPPKARNLGIPLVQFSSVQFQFQFQFQLFQPPFPGFYETSRNCKGQSDSAPRPQMSNGVQGVGQRAPLGNYLGKNFRRFPRRIPPPRSAKSGNTTIPHVSRTQCSLCCSGGTARA